MALTNFKRLVDAIAEEGSFDDTEYVVPVGAVLDVELQGAPAFTIRAGERAIVSGSPNRVGRTDYQHPYTLTVLKEDIRKGGVSTTVDSMNPQYSERGDVKRLTLQGMCASNGKILTLTQSVVP